MSANDAGFDSGRYRGRDLSANQLCMFCGAPADSQEDIIPSWLSRQGIVPQGTVRPVTYTSHGAAVKEWRSQTLAFLKIKAVCVECNNGWMSRIENTVKPHLRTMMQGRTVHLDPAAQIDLGTWASLKVMIWESVAEGVVTSTTDRELMWKFQQPPSYAVVVLGQAPASPDSEFGIQQVFIKAQRHRGAPLDKVSATALTLGDFVAWVILNPTKPAGTPFQATAINDDLLTIFPPTVQSIRWPPTVTLTDQERRSLWRRYLVIQDEIKLEHQRGEQEQPSGPDRDEAPRPVS